MVVFCFMITQRISYTNIYIKRTQQYYQISEIKFKLKTNKNEQEQKRTIINQNEQKRKKNESERTKAKEICVNW